MYFASPYREIENAQRHLAEHFIKQNETTYITFSLNDLNNLVGKKLSEINLKKMKNS